MLGANGFEVSEIGLGCWQLGGSWGEPLSQDAAFKIMHSAIAHGVTFFDTADVYGAGQSESFIGDFMKETKTHLRVATKYGRGEVYPAGYSEESLRMAVENSLRRLGVSSLDLLQLHCIPMAVLQQGDVFNWLRKIKQEGLIQHFGASVESVEEGLLCIEQEGLLSLQVIFNIFRQKLVTDLLPQAQTKGIGIIARVPLASGLLSGKFTSQTIFSEKDHRNFNRNGEAFNVGETFAGLPFEKGIELSETISTMVPPGMSMAELALRWILDHEAVSTVIPGASSAKQAEDNTALSELPPLSEELHQKLSEFYEWEVKQHIRGPY
jgi:aryl-alcohol dehydrogenase-like predicted oxidoreductase